MTGLTCLVWRIKDTGDQVSYDRANLFSVGSRKLGIMYPMTGLTCLVCRIKDTRDQVSCVGADPSPASPMQVNLKYNSQ